MKSKHTKRALLSSVLALVLCFSMMLGTTFAWFTDSVESTNNIIKAGNLDVEVTNEKGDITGQAELFQDVKLWEPGVVSYENLTVKNAGSLALQYQFCINFQNENTVTTNGKEYGLSSALQVAVIEGPVDKAATDRDALVASISKWTPLKNLVEEGVLYPVNNMPDPAEVPDAASDKTYTVVIWWEPGEDDNNWNVQNGKTVSDYDQAKNNNYLHIDLGVNLIATQYTYEEDSFDDQYDVGAELPVYGVGSGANAVYDATDTAYEVPVMDGSKQIGFALIQKEALAGSIDDVVVEILKTDVYDELSNIPNAVTYDVQVAGLKENSGEMSKIGLPALSGYNTAVVYHYGEKIGTVSYNAGESYVEFLTDDFSPFTMAFSLVEEGTLDSNLPVAVVTDMDEYENVVLDWESYGGWSPSNPDKQTLYSAYKFKAPHDSSTVESCAYKGWSCDYYVSIDKDIEEGVIFLGGNYGSFGWVGFENPIAIGANEEIPLLGSVANSPWTYEDIVSFVGEFMCGVAETYGHEGKLAGATFTVKLRLTNPDDATEYYDVNTVNYKFVERTAANDMATLKAALSAGKKEIYITDAITLTESLGATNVTFIGEGEDAGINFNGYNIGGSGEITYKNLKLTTVSLPNDGTNGERYGWYGGIDYNGHSVANYVNCTISGVFTTYSPVVNATDCTFDYYVQDGEEFYNIFMYAACDLTATRCTFVYGDRAIKAYSESVNQYELTLTDCKFVADEGFILNKALINVSSGNLTLTVTNNTVDEALSSLDLYKTEGGATVTVQ